MEMAVEQPQPARPLISEHGRRCAVSRTGFIDHIGIGVPDLAAAKRYYDDLMPVLGLKQWFPTAADGGFNYGPDGGRGTPRR